MDNYTASLITWACVHIISTLTAMIETTLHHYGGSVFELMDNRRKAKGKPPFWDPMRSWMNKDKGNTGFRNFLDRNLFVIWSDFYHLGKWFIIILSFFALLVYEPYGNKLYEVGFLVVWYFISWKIQYHTRCFWIKWLI